MPYRARGNSTFDTKGEVLYDIITSIHGTFFYSLNKNAVCIYLTPPTIVGIYIYLMM
jgi:hypothetical protein